MSGDVSDGVLEALDGYLRFQEPTILEPSRRWTVRVGLDREFDVGDRVALVDEDGAAFGVATVRSTLRTTADDFVRFDVDGYPRFVTTAEFLEHLAPYYPDRPIEPRTIVDAIELEDVVDETAAVLDEVDAPAVVR